MVQAVMYARSTSNVETNPPYKGDLVGWLIGFVDCRSIGLCVIWVCIRSSSSSHVMLNSNVGMSVRCQYIHIHIYRNMGFWAAFCLSNWN